FSGENGPDAGSGKRPFGNSEGPFSWSRRMLTAETLPAEGARYAAGLVCIPGLWAGSRVWRGFASYLGHRGWECHLLDVRGVVGGLTARAAAVREYAAALPAPAGFVGPDAGGADPRRRGRGRPAPAATGRRGAGAQPRRGVARARGRAPLGTRGRRLAAGGRARAPLARATARGAAPRDLRRGAGGPRAERRRVAGPSSGDGSGQRARAASRSRAASSATPPRRGAPPSAPRRRRRRRRSPGWPPARDPPADEAETRSRPWWAASGPEGRDTAAGCSEPAEPFPPVGSRRDLVAFPAQQLA